MLESSQRLALNSRSDGTIFLLTKLKNHSKIVATCKVCRLSNEGVRELNFSMSLEKSERFSKLKLVIVFVTCFLISGIVAAPVAAQAASGTKTFLAGYVYDYWGQHHISRNSGSNIATQTTVWKTTSQFPAGWIGLQPRVYLENGVLILQSSTTYNSTATMSYANMVPAGKIVNPVYALAPVYAWNGNGYTTFWPARTPNV